MPLAGPLVRLSRDAAIALLREVSSWFFFGRYWRTKHSVLAGTALP